MQNDILTAFEQQVISFAFREIDARAFETWTYAHADEIALEMSGETRLALLEADFGSDQAIVDVLNPWFRKRFPLCFADNDLRSLRRTAMSGRFKILVRATLA
jgi:hypothetical protein